MSASYVNDMTGICIGDVVQFYNVYCSFPAYDFNHLDPKARQVSYFETLSGLVLTMQLGSDGDRMTVGISIIVASAQKRNSDKQNQMFSVSCNEEVNAYAGKICKIFLFNTSYLSDKFSILSNAKDIR